MSFPHRCLAVAALLVVPTAAAADRALTPGGLTPPRSPGLAAHAHRGTKAGLGKVLTSAFGGEIFGFDVDENGTDGILDDAVTQGSGLKSAIETFDTTTGSITKVVKTLESPTGSDELVTFGIVGSDVGLIDDERDETQHPSTRRDRFFLADPVAGGKITARWMPAHPANSVLWEIAQNQTTSTQVAVMLRLGSNGTSGALNVWDSSTGALLHVFPLRRSGGLLAEDTATNQAVLAGSDPYGAPIFTLVNLATGKTFEFHGLNFGAGSVNGVAVDSTTGIACTATEENAAVEFYTLSNGVGKEVQLPGNVGQLNSGAAVTNDPVNGLFLVAQPVTSTGGRGSSIDVYDETGHLVETINGFNFSNDTRPPSFFVKIAINPSTRTGWVNGPTNDQLQQFFY